MLVGLVNDQEATYKGFKRCPQPGGAILFSERGVSQ